MVIHWVTTQPTPYNDFLLSCLASQSDFDLLVHFLEPSCDTHPWTERSPVGYRSRVVARRFFDLQLLGRAATGQDALFVVADWHCPVTVLLLGTLGLRSARFILLTDTPNVNRRRSPAKATLRRKWLKWVFQRASYVMGTGWPAISILEQMGCPDEKLVDFPYFVDLDFFSPATGPRRRTVADEIVFLSSGRLVNSLKGHDDALRALATA